MQLGLIAVMYLPLAIMEECPEELKPRMNNYSPWYCGVAKRILCALKPGVTRAQVVVDGYDKNRERVFSCYTTLRNFTIKTNCGNNGNRVEHDVPKPYEIMEHRGENVIGVWLTFEKDNLLRVESNGLSIVRTPTTGGPSDIVNATALGMAGNFKYCFAWDCEKGVNEPRC